MAKLLNTFAPPFKLVGAYFIISICFAIFSLVALLWADFSILTDLKTAAFFHTYFIGFVISIIIGSIYQLTSVVLERPFFSLKGAYQNVFIYLFGLSIFLVGMLVGKSNLIYIGGILLYIGLLYFGMCYFFTFIGAKFKSFSAFCFFVSSILFLLGISVGLLLVMTLFGGFEFDYLMMLRLHLYFVFGFIFFVLLGASSVLLPMFSLAHNVNFGFYYCSASLYIFGFVLIFIYPYESVFAFLAAFLMFILQCYLILKNRVRKTLNIWSSNLYFSFLNLILAVVLFKFNLLEEAIFCLLYGFLYPFITAHIYKIMPFLIWYHYISKFVGKIKVPMLEDMVLKYFAYAALILNLFGVLFWMFGLKYIAIIFILISAICVFANMINFLRYIKFGAKL